MARKIRLKSGEEVNIRARCANTNCGLLLICNNNPTENTERTVHPREVANLDDLKGIPFISCAHCR